MTAFLLVVMTVTVGRSDAEAGTVCVFGGENPYDVLEDAMALSVDSLGPVVECLDGLIGIGMANEEVSEQ